MSAKQRQETLVWLVTAVTLLSGLLDLFSLIRPWPQLNTWDVLSPDFVQASRLTTMGVGFALVITAVNLRQRKRRAWWLVFMLALLSLGSLLATGGQVVEITATLLLILVLFMTRREFTVRSRRPRFRRASWLLLLGFLLAFTYMTLGFWLLERSAFGETFSLGQSLGNALRFLLLVGDGALQPQTVSARWFLTSLQAILLLAFLSGLWALFRPVSYELVTRPGEVAHAVTVAQRAGRSSQDFFKLLPDKSYFFTDSGFVAYAVAHNVAVALGDPVAAPDRMRDNIAGFTNFVRQNGWTAVFYEAPADQLDLYTAHGFKKFKLGEDAIVDLQNFTLAGGEQKNLRKKVGRVERNGFTAVMHDPPVADEIIAAARTVSDLWLADGKQERGFTQGQFSDDYVRHTRLWAVYDADGVMQAFTNLVPSYDATTALNDLMRRRPDTVPNLMDFLFVKLFLHCQAAGYARFNLGLAPLTGYQPGENPTAAERTIHRFAQQLDSLFSAAGLTEYKAKFATIWEPRYLLYRRVADLPRIALAIGELTAVDEYERSWRDGLRQLRALVLDLAAAIRGSQRHDLPNRYAHARQPEVSETD